MGAERKGEQTFRAFIGPVSLKHAHDIGTRDVQDGFPGLHRPGLIEALCGSELGAGIPAVFPGLHRPGLIEALSVSGRMGNPGKTFRAFIGPVSLKRSILPACVCTCVTFRAFIGPVSLKHDLGHLRLEVPQLLSGPSSARSH